jgi:hypothetical protein
MSDVHPSDPWKSDADVTDMTATDLEASRGRHTRVSDPDRDLHLYLETIVRHSDLPNWNYAADRALRVELGHIIDNWEVDFERADYDIAYTIPPVGWLDQQDFEQLEIVDESEVADAERTIGFNTPEEVVEMAKAAVEYGAYETMSELVKTGAKRLCGHAE